VSLLPNDTKSNRSSGRVRRGPHTQATLVWQTLFASILVDPIISLLVTPRIPRDEALLVATLFALACLPFLAQQRLHTVLSKLRHLHARNLEGNSQLLPLLLGVGVFAIIVVKALLLIRLPIFISATMLTIALAGGLKYLVQIKKQSSNDRELFETNPWAKVQRWEQQVLVFSILPLLFARLISTCGAFAEIPAGQEVERLLFIAVSALFLAMLRPERSFFISMCPRCKHPVPIVFRDLGSCLNCSEHLRYAYYAWVNGITPLQTQDADSQRAEQGDRGTGPDGTSPPNPR